MCLVMGDSTLICKNITHAIICCNQERLFANNGWMQKWSIYSPHLFWCQIDGSHGLPSSIKIILKGDIHLNWCHLEGAYPFANFAFIVFEPKHANDIPQIKQNPRSSNKI
jgi:hypothetical protein